MNCKSYLIASVLILLAMMLSSCSDCCDKAISLENQVNTLKKKNDKLIKQLAECQTQLISQDEQIKNLTKFSDKQFEYLIKLKKITLDKLTGPYDENYDGYDDGITVHIKPIDVDGDTVKVASAIKVVLFSLEDKPVIVGQISLAPEEARKSWISKLWANQFIVKCPFKIGKNLKHIKDVTVRVELTEVLTGKTFVAQKLVPVKIRKH